MNMKKMISLLMALIIVLSAVLIAPTSVMAEGKTGLYEESGVMYYYKDGEICKDNTLVKQDGVWYHVKDGKNNPNEGATLVKYEGTWYYCKNGKLNKTNTLVKYNGVWYHAKNGKYNPKEAPTLVKYEGTWYYCKNGKLNKSNTLVKYNKVWYHVKNGKYNPKEVPVIARYNSKSYYCKKGKLAKTFSGTITINGFKYKVTKGVLVCKKHNYAAATCTLGKRCKNCSVISGSALGHTVGTAYCSRCNKNLNFKGVTNDFAYQVKNGKATIISYNKLIDGAFTIPSMLNYCRVTAIGKEAFSTSLLTSLSLPSTLESIGFKAFYMCFNLESITLPAKLKTVSGEAFESCKNLKTVKVSKNTKLGSKVFNDCNNPKITKY